MATMVLPARSLEQRMEALSRANEIRTARAEWKRKLKAGDASVLDLMGDPLCESMKVYDVLIAQRRIGRVKANKILSKLMISPSKTLGGLTSRQRIELLVWITR